MNATGKCRWPRVLADLDSGHPGPTLIVSGGIHGNEPAGVLAALEVTKALGERGLQRGRLVALVGNRSALGRGCRYVERDLNRRWFPDEIAELRERDPAEDTVEDREQRELLERIEPLLAGDRPAIFIDLHSTSGGGPPFVCGADTLRNLDVAAALPLPMILGLEEIIVGSMLGYLCNLGHSGLAIEGGQHDDPLTSRRHASCIWLILHKLSMAQLGETKLEHHRRLLEDACEGLPGFVEIRHRHVVETEDEFVMKPGFTGFEPVEMGEVVAEDQRGPIEAPESGRMLLPRYQGQGEDGFFVTRDFPEWRLHLSAFMRRLRLDLLAPLLPGVRRDPDHPDQLFTDRPSLSPLTSEMLALWGYRRRVVEGDRLVITRRRGDGPVDPFDPLRS
ncbi:MAG: succinylglutamate desuccinylase/aspartoacylase family protein [Acidobacteriota bacterium]